MTSRLSEITGEAALEAVSEEEFSSPSALAAGTVEEEPLRGPKRRPKMLGAFTRPFSAETNCPCRTEAPLDNSAKVTSDTTAFSSKTAPQSAQKEFPCDGSFSILLPRQLEQTNFIFSYSGGCFDFRSFCVDNNYLEGTVKLTMYIYLLISCPCGLLYNYRGSIGYLDQSDSSSKAWNLNWKISGKQL